MRTHGSGGGRTRAMDGVIDAMGLPSIKLYTCGVRGWMARRIHRYLEGMLLRAADLVATVKAPGDGVDRAETNRRDRSEGHGRADLKCEESRPRMPMYVFG